MKSLKSFLICIALLVASLSSVSAEEIFQEGKPKLKGPKINLPSFAELSEALAPGVVNIAVESEAPSEEEGADLAIPGLPFQFKRENKPVSSMGSGFVISEDGYIVSNNHVIEKAGKVIVRLPDDKEPYTAKIIGKDPKTDIALLKIETKKTLHPLYLGNSDSLKVGDWVLAIGHQFQLGQTVTLGIVSAKERKVPLGGPYDNFIQTDASINPGSSGGPLFDIDGAVVGINTAIFSPGRSQFGGTGFNIGIGFAAPVNLAKSVIRQLKETGRVTRGWLGVLIQPITPDVAYAMDLDSYYGALVGHVMKGSPAEKAGFEVGDVIRSFNGHAVNENDDLPLLVANTPVGMNVDIEIIRGGKSRILKATIELLKEEQQKIVNEDVKTDDLGLSLENVPDSFAKALKLTSREGVRIKAVKPGSLAEASGLIVDDVIEGIVTRGRGIHRITDVDDYYKTIKAAEKGKPLMVFLRRKDPIAGGSGTTTLYLTIKMAE